MIPFDSVVFGLFRYVSRVLLVPSLNSIHQLKNLNKYFSYVKKKMNKFLRGLIDPWSPQDSSLSFPIFWLPKIPSFLSVLKFSFSRTFKLGNFQPLFVVLKRGEFCPTFSKVVDWPKNLTKYQKIFFQITPLSSKIVTQLLEIRRTEASTVKKRQNA